MKPIKQFNINICRTEPEQVLQNKDDIAKLKEQESADISNLEARITTTESSIDSLNEKTENNANNIASNSYEISVLKQTVSKNTRDITTNSSAIIQTNNSLNEVKSNVDSISSNLSILQSEVTSQRRELTATEANVTQLTANLSTVEKSLNEIEAESSSTTLQVEKILSGEVIVPKANEASNIPVGGLLFDMMADDIFMSDDGGNPSEVVKEANHATIANRATTALTADSADNSTHANSVVANFLTQNSNDDDVFHAITHFKDDIYNEPIYFVQGNEIYNLKSFSDDYLIFDCSKANILDEENNGSEIYPTFKKVNNKWQFNLIETAIAPTISFANFMYQGFGGLEIHFELHSFYYGNRGNLSQQKPVNFLTSLNQYNNLNAMTTRFIHGYVIQDGSIFMNLIEMEFNSETGLFKIKYIKGDGLKIEAENIDLSKLTMEEFSTMYPLF